jgi:hypothetical protein
MIVYNEDMTAGLDPGYDVGLMSSGGDLEVYTLLTGVKNDFSFTRQALPVSVATTTAVPVGIDCVKGGEVTFSAYTVPLGTNRFWLEDRTTGIFTDLTTKSYTVTLPANTYGTGRFYIIASTSTPTDIRQTEAGETGLRIWSVNDRIIIRGEVSDKAICEVYDAGGHKIMHQRLADGELNTVDLPADSHGVLLVRVTDGVKVTTRKLALL